MLKDKLKLEAEQRQVEEAIQEDLRIQTVAISSLKKAVQVSKQHVDA